MRTDDTRHYATTLARLESGEAIDAAAVVVVAHPDDETLAMGGRLSVFRQLTIIQLTDGAPASGIDAQHLGFADNAAYAQAREREACEALAILGVRCRRICLHAPDQASVFSALELAERLISELRAAELVFTHPYEGGHPDHDTAALIVQRVCTALDTEAHAAPLRLEFASYHLRGAEMITGAFFGPPQSREIAIELTADERELKRRALAAYTSQAAVLTWFDPAIERYRIAPTYDFCGPAPPGRALYDLFDWEMTSARWQSITRPWLCCRGGER